MIRSTSLLFLAGCFGVANGICQEPASTTPVTNPEQPILEYAVTLDAFSTTKLPGDGSDRNLLRNFDIKTNDFQLAASTLTAQFTKGQFGLHFDGGYGQIYKTMSAFDPWGGANRFFGQAYVSVRPFKKSEFDLDFGKFYTNVGAEVPDTISNFQYSRSLLFVLSAPYYHFGLRGSIPVTKSLVVGAQVSNGWNDVVNNTGGHTLGITGTYTKKLFNFTETYLGGPEPLFVPNSLFPGLAKRCQLFDSVLKLTPTSTVNAYIEGVYGMQKRADAGHDAWYGIATAVSIPLSARWSISPRWEFYNDAAGATSGTVEQLQEVTGTLQYQVRKFPLIARAEYRIDHSDHQFFAGDGSKAPSQNQQTALVGLVYTLKGKL